MGGICAMNAVHFIGAGPGAVDLITLRGKSLLENADVIVYAGSLVNPDILRFAGHDCEIYNSAHMTLDEVAEVIQNAVSENKKVVRLHTGDPCLYGAIREQIDRLAELDIECEICPGVSSFCAAAASLKAEYTLPGVSQTVILTRAAGRTLVPERENIRSLAAHKASMIIFLSAGLIETVSEDLISGGYPSETPAAVVYKASWPEEKIIRCNVGGLSKAAADGNISKTALICVGDFLQSDYELSKLYSAGFSTGYREAKV